MIAAVNDSLECIQLLLHYGGIALFQKDCSAMDALKLTLKYESHNVATELHQQITYNMH